MEHAIRPVTALKFCQIGSLYLLAGEGSHVKIFDHANRKLLLQRQLFQIESIHGFFSRLTPGDEDGSRFQQVLAWGGRSFCIFRIEEPMGSTQSGQVIINWTVLETKVDDWVLDARLQSSPVSSVETSDFFRLLLVTSHNEVTIYNVNAQTKTLSERRMQVLSDEHSSLLYSAHMTLLSENRILVAAGTVFGKVVLWSFYIDILRIEAPPQLLGEFQAHNGSVFGVRLSGMLRSEEGTLKQYLASCSDDRTITVWSLEEHGPEGDMLQAQLLASAAGHASRIWNIQFLSDGKSNFQILSVGEDSTSQIWQLTLGHSDPGTNSRGQNANLFLNHMKTLSHHSGKNIWAFDCIILSGTLYLVATGGGDGRILSFLQDLKKGYNLPEAISGNFSMTQVGVLLSNDSQTPNAVLDPKSILHAMKGSWKITRHIRSVNPLYPSGTLTGIAEISKRAPTDKPFEDEYFYSEKGDYVTEQGLKMKASRQYIYRYRSDRNEASAWFAKPDGSQNVDYLFHVLNFDKSAPMQDSDDAEICQALSAKGHHLCIDDDYYAKYAFRFEETNLLTWKLQYSVKGPSKDYIANASYSRLTLDAELQGSSNCGNIEVDGLIPPLIRDTLKSDSFRRYAWLNAEEFLVTTDNGAILLGAMSKTQLADKLAGNVANEQVSPVSWKFVAHHNDLRSISLSSSIHGLNIAFVIGVNGSVYLFDRKSDSVLELEKRLPRPIYCKAQQLSDAWQIDTKSDNSATFPTIALCTAGFGEPCVEARLYLRQEDMIRCVMSRLLLLPKIFAVTSSYFFANRKMIVLGSREGSLCFYDLAIFSDNNSTLQPIAVFQLTHQDAVTQIRDLECARNARAQDEDYILTTGRDGRYAIHKIFSTKSEPTMTPNLQLVHESTLPFGPNIEGACFEQKSHHLVLWGFRSTSFVVWNDNLKEETMAVECGGAHRNWAFTPEDSSGGGSFVWTKASTCNVYTQGRSSHSVLQSGGHGREIKTAAVSTVCAGQASPSHLLATGAEDTAVRLFKYGPDQGLQSMRTMMKHKTGIQSLKWSSDGTYLFSAAGYEEFYIWRLSEIPGFGTGISCLAECPKVTDDGDLRVMDFDVLAQQSRINLEEQPSNPDFVICLTYSDSSIRIFRFSQTPEDSQFELLAQGSYSTYCLTQVHVIEFESISVMCTAGADGYIAIWPLAEDHVRNSSEIEQHTALTESVPSALTYISRIQMHQNSIRSLTCTKLNSEKHLLVTGGDDQALSFTVIQSSNLTLPSVTSKKPSKADRIIPNAHVSAITGLAWLSERRFAGRIELYLATIGTDQRLKTWQVVFNEHEHQHEERGFSVDSSLDVTSKSDEHCSVADASDLTYSTNGDEGRLFVVGVGIECWKIIDGVLSSSTGQSRMLGE